jgi:hypothetical protein
MLEWRPRLYALLVLAVLLAVAIGHFEPIVHNWEW